MVKNVYYHHHHHDIRFSVCFPHKHELTQPVITCSTLTIKTLQQGVKYVQSSQQKHQNEAIGRSSGVFIVNFEHIFNFFLVFLLLTLSR